MKLTFSLLFFSLCCLVANAQRFTYNQGGTDVKSYYEEIPYETINGKMFIKVEVAGKQRKFLFDTGAPVQITPALYHELNPAVITRNLVDDANGTKDSINVVIAPDIKLNSITFSHVPALVLGSAAYICWQVDGVIGSNLLSKSIVRIVPGQHIIILTNDAKRLDLHKKNATTLLTDYVQAYPYVVVDLPGKKTVDIGFDTGDSDFMALTEGEMNRLGKFNVYEKQSVGYGSGHLSIFGAQKYDTTYRLKFPVMTIAGTAFNNVTTETNRTNLPRMGAKILNYGIVTLDFIHHLFYFEPTGTGLIDLNDKHWAMQPMIAGNQMIVGVVWDKLKEILKPGEQITAIDDMAFPTVDLCDWVNRQSSVLKDKRTATLTIKDTQGNSRKVTIVKE